MNVCAPSRIDTDVTRAGMDAAHVAGSVVSVNGGAVLASY